MDIIIRQYGVYRVRHVRDGLWIFRGVPNTCIFDQMLWHLACWNLPGISLCFVVLLAHFINICIIFLLSDLSFLMLKKMLCNCPQDIALCLYSTNQNKFQVNAVSQSSYFMPLFLLWSIDNEWTNCYPGSQIMTVHSVMTSISINSALWMFS